MVRKTALVTAILAALSTQAQALGLGDIKLNSALNQPLDAEIELVGTQSGDAEELRVRLASPEAYSRAGIERLHSHTKMKFEVVRGAGGVPVVRITSRQPVREPFLDFLIEANWSSGQVVREYTVLVDPPVFMPSAPPVTRAAVTPAPVRSSVPESAVVQPSAAPVSRPARVQSALVPQEYRTQRNDTLWKVASEVRPDTGVSIEQTMLGLLEANPRAFIDDNINNLKAGYVLRVPSRDELTVLPKAEALEEVRRQNKMWRDGRAGDTASTAPASDSAPAGDGEVASSAEDGGAESQPASVSEGHLKLVAPEPGVVEQVAATGVADVVGDPESGGADAAVMSMRQELNMALEALESQRQENSELSGRLAQLEEQIASMHRLIELKDQELATIQENEQPAATPPVDAPTAPVASADDAPVSEPSSSEKIEAMLANPLAKVGLGVLAAFAVILAWIGIRRRRTDDADFQESILAGDVASEADTSREETAAGDDAGAEAPAPGKQAASGSDSSLFTDFSVSDMGYMQDDAEADPLAESDVYLAYGRYQQAEELIKAAVDKSPERSDLKVKLLEVYYAARNVAEFDTQAEALLAQLEDQNHVEWKRVAEMGRELNPGNPLYGDAAADTAPAADAEPADEAATVVSDADDDNLLDFDMDLDAGADAGMAESAGSSSPEAAVAELEPGAGVQEFNDAELEYDLTVDTADVAEDDGGEGALSRSDEAATKLDLARAYIEMGDPEGARSILQEVLEEGNDGQKSEAEGLMSQIA